MAKKMKRTRAGAAGKSKARKSKLHGKAAAKTTRRRSRPVPDSPTLFGSFLKIFEPSPPPRKK
jgi:hypothetical protein